MMDDGSRMISGGALNPGKKQISTVEALRGVAAPAVTWFHLTNTYARDRVNYSGSDGWLGIDMFFVISGFIIPYSLHRSEYKLAYFPRFLLRRLVRLEPPYFISIAPVLILWELAAHTPGFTGAPPNYSLGQILAHFLYLIPLTSYPWLNSVYWTLAYEFVFYILVGLLQPVLSHRSLLFTAILVACTQAIDIALRDQPTGAALLFLSAYVARGRVSSSIRPGFRCLRRRLQSVEPLVALVSLRTAFFIVFFDIPRLRVLGFLGAISYSLYLLHVPFGGRVVNLGRRPFSGIGSFAGGPRRVAGVRDDILEVRRRACQTRSKRVVLRPLFTRLASENA